jgi:phage baseplate assembly protein W
MIPDSNVFSEELEDFEYPSETYKINVTVQPIHRINGYTDGLDAVGQAVYLILNTERYEHVIYSWDYGVELVDLIGKPIPYVMSELPRRIEEALTQDDRIETVKDFEFEKYKNQLEVRFTVVSNVGDLSTTLEVNI